MGCVQALRAPRTGCSDGSQQQAAALVSTPTSDLMYSSGKSYPTCSHSIGGGQAVLVASGWALSLVCSLWPSGTALKQLLVTSESSQVGSRASVSLSSRSLAQALFFPKPGVMPRRAREHAGRKHGLCGDSHLSMLQPSPSLGAQSKAGVKGAQSQLGHQQCGAVGC